MRWSWWVVRESGDRVRECARIDCTQEKSSVVFRDGDIGGVGAVRSDRLEINCPTFPGDTLAPCRSITHQISANTHLLLHG